MQISRFIEALVTSIREGVEKANQSAGYPICPSLEGVKVKCQIRVSAFHEETLYGWAEKVVVKAPYISDFSSQIEVMPEDSESPLISSDNDDHIVTFELTLSEKEEKLC